MKALTTLSLIAVLVTITLPKSCSATMWMTYHDWFYARQFKMPTDPYEAEELRDQVSREEKALREAYVRGVIDTLMLLSTTKTDNKEMLDGLMDLTVDEMSDLVTRIYEEQPQYRQKPVIFILGYVMPQMRTRMGKPQEEEKKVEKVEKTPEAQ
ncbi:MAG TPA: hypothetical protein ACFYD2_07550 [Candidatus Avalokitesvara rifleensis]|uniref:hypothetical protein n=1 Tax=Candidatus Avalokitesvara rifleensis TaxID=3367620 RepID=UPI002713B871|nr:hypothetical protein [Candidatus Brocadiales bacterium]